MQNQSKIEQIEMGELPGIARSASRYCHYQQISPRTSPRFRTTPLTSQPLTTKQALTNKIFQPTWLKSTAIPPASHINFDNKADTNTSNISTNQQNIQEIHDSVLDNKNKADINPSSITTNASNITSNEQDIATNSNVISANQQITIHKRHKHFSQFIG